MTYTSPQQQNFYLQQMGQEMGPYTMFDLQNMARTGHVQPSMMARSETGTWFPITQIPGVFSPKDWITTVLLSFFVGWLGIDRFYLGSIGLGIAKLLTFGGFGIWALIDFILILMRKVKDGNGLPLG